MDQSEATEASEDQSRIRHYANMLNPLFWDDEFNRVDRLFELVCTLVRASGMKDTGWDSHLESVNLLDDLRRLCQSELPIDEFPFPDSTRARLTLISYCHVTEMNFPYELVANLLRLHLGLNYCVHPFAHLDRPITKKVNGAKIVDRIITASPDKKIKEIASRPGTFSPCVEFDAQPIYAKVPGTELQPYWPATLSSYKLQNHP